MAPLLTFIGTRGSFIQLMAFGMPGPPLLLPVEHALQGQVSKRPIKHKQTS